MAKNVSNSLKKMLIFVFLGIKRKESDNIVV